VATSTGGQDSATIALIGPRPPGRPEPIRPGAQAFLAVLPGGYDLRTHYHRVDQFQLVVGGGAAFANHRVRSGHLHYSDRLQPYGPIRPEDGGLAFFTLRAATGGGVFYMPESRPLLGDGLGTLPEPVSARRNLTFDLTTEEGELVADDDGLRVLVLLQTAGATTPPVAIGGAGAYIVIVDGGLDASDGGFGPGSLCWLEPGVELDPLTAGPDGLRLAVLQYPGKAVLPGAHLAPTLTTAAG
jgi:hypothetical protein